MVFKISTRISGTSSCRELISDNISESTTMLSFIASYPNNSTIMNIEDIKEMLNIVIKDLAISEYETKIIIPKKRKVIKIQLRVYNRAVINPTMISLLQGIIRDSISSEWGKEIIENNSIFPTVSKLPSIGQTVTAEEKIKIIKDLIHTVYQLDLGIVSYITHESRSK